MVTDIESAGILSDSLAQAIDHQDNDQPNEKRRSELRVFKKSSPNGVLTVYLGKRDFVDHVSYVDPIDGVILIDKEFLDGRKVFGHVLATFRYGRDDLDVLGLNFRRELYLINEQIYPDPKRNHTLKTCPYYIEKITDAQNSNNPNNVDNRRIRLTRLQERLIKKLGNNAFPFFFHLPPFCPSSVTLQPGSGDSGKPCGVEYELKAYIANNLEEKPCKKDAVRLAIRKIMYAPSKQGEQPFIEVSKDFVMSPNKLNLEVSLDKELYHHGERIAVNVHISNNSNRYVKRLKVSVRQHAEICLFSTAQYKCTVAEIESDEGCPVGPGSTLSKVYYLRPLLANNKHKRGLALDGQIKHEDTNLASSTLVTEDTSRENYGIVVQYKVRVKLALGPLGGDLSAELPITLMHQKQDDINTVNFDNEGESFKTRRTPSDYQLSMMTACKCFVNNIPKNTSSKEIYHVMHDLIQLEDAENDIIFEDFGRLRMNNGISMSNRSDDLGPYMCTPPSQED